MTDKNDSIETKPVIAQALLDHVMANYTKPADLIGENGMPKQQTKAVIEAAQQAQMNRLILSPFRRGFRSHACSAERMG
jgi:hypothetical protein